MANPLYRAKRKSYVVDRLVYKGDEFTYDGVPSIHWEPLNDEAKDMMKKAKQPKGKALLQKAKEAKAAQMVEGDGVAGQTNHPSDYKETDEGQDTGTGADGNANTELKTAGDYTDEELTELIAKEFATFKHDKDHFTTEGKPNLNVLKERLGFAVDRKTTDRLFPNFKRQDNA